MLAEFARTKQLHIMCKEQYSAMIKKLEAGGEVKGIREEEWAAIRDAGGYSAEDVFGDLDKINRSTPAASSRAASITATKPRRACVSQRRPSRRRLDLCSTTAMTNGQR